MEPTFRQKLNRGYADGFSGAVEIALVPVVFGGLGWLVDRAAGTAPVFLLAFVVFAFVGVGAKLWLRYDKDMAKEEADKIWNRGPAASTSSEGEGS